MCPEQKSLSALLTLDNFQEKQRELRQFLQLLWLHGSAGVYSLSYLYVNLVEKNFLYYIEFSPYVCINRWPY